MKRQILMSIMTIGVTAMLIGAGAVTFAVSVKKKTVTKNTTTLTADRGSCRDLLDIRDNDEWWGHSVTATWTADNMMPGDEFPFRFQFVELRKHFRSPQINHINIICDYSVTEEYPQTESDTDPNTDGHPDNMAKHMIITRCKYLGWGPCNCINCLTNSKHDWRIQDIDGDGKITFYDFKLDPLKNLPVPKKWWSRYWFLLSIKFDSETDNDFQGDTFNLTISFIAKQDTNQQKNLKQTTSNRSLLDNKIN